MLVERLGDDERAAVLADQVVEVKRPSLRVTLPGKDDRVSTATDDRSLDQRTRVQADDGSGVVDRVEVLGAPRGVARLRPLGRPDDHLLVAGERVAVPDPAVVGVRPHEDAHPRQRRIAAELVEPAADEGRLVGGDLGGGADVEQIGLRGVEPDGGAEAGPLLAGLPGEPVVVAVCPHRDHVLRRQPVQVDRLPPLHLVPDVGAVGLLLEHALVRQVVPAVDGERHGQAHRPGGADQLVLVHLGDERRHHECVVAAVAEHRGERLGDGQRPRPGPQSPDEHRHQPWPLPGATPKPHEPARHPAGRAVAKEARVAIDGGEVAEIVEGGPEPRCQRLPRVVPNRGVAPRDPVELGRQRLR